MVSAVKQRISFRRCPLWFTVLFLVVFPSPQLLAVPASSETEVVPADYIIAGNLNHELGQRWLKARGLKGQGDFDQARNQYILLLNTYPDLIQARYEYVQVLQVLGRHDEMEVELETLLELVPGNLDYKYTLGMLFFEHGQKKQGGLLLEEVWHERPRVDLGRLLYRTYIQHDQKQKGLAVLEYLYKQSVDDQRLQDELFVLYIELGDDLKAQNFSPSLSENSPASLKQLILGAKLHRRLGLTHLAADYWQAVLKIQPDYKPAHENLVGYFTENGRDGEALPHKIFLYSSQDDDSGIAGEIGDYYVNISECSQAVFFLKRSLALEPNQVKRLKGLAYCYKDIGEINQSAQTFSAYLTIAPDPSSDDRLTAAKIFKQAGMVDQSVLQYRTLLVEQPGHIDFLEALAELETARGSFQAALQVWHQVAKRKPDDVNCRIQILSLSDILGISDVQSVLAEIHNLDQNNHKVSLLLALAAFENGDQSKGMELFAPLAENEFFSADLLALRGKLFLMLNLPEHSFADLTEARKLNPDLEQSYTLILLRAAGELGRLDEVVSLNDTYHFDTSTDLSLVLAYADALAGCLEGSQSVKLYREIIGSEHGELKAKAYLGLAKLYTAFGFDYEAEQENRINWLETKNTDALVYLVTHLLRQKRNGDAEYWLDQYTASGGGFDPALYHVDVLLLMADDEPGRALSLARGFKQACEEAVYDCGGSLLQNKLDQARIFVMTGYDGAATELIEQLKIEYPDDLRPRVFELFMAVRNHDDALSASLMENLLQQVQADSGDLFRLRRIVLEYGLPSFAKPINRSLVKSQPRSLKYGLNLISFLINQSSFDEAHDVVTRLLPLYPESLLLHLYGAQVSLARGEFDQGLNYLNTSPKPVTYKGELLRARLLWGAFKWEEALQVYQHNLEPDAEKKFIEECEILQIKVDPLPDPSLWMRVVKPMGNKVSVLERSFNNGRAGTSNDFAKTGARFFAMKRWQDRFKLELSARTAVRKREYFHAVNQYEAMGEYLTGEPTLLLDLAGVYSSLNRVGDEAVVYEKISQINPDFPGLTAAMTRNELRRRPRTGVKIQYLEEDGWDGYKDIKVWKQEVHGWYSPEPRREGFVSVSQLYYDGDKGKDVRGQELLLGVTSNVLDYFKLDLSGGVHILGDDYPNKNVFDLSITGVAGDFLKSYVGIKRYVVKDTLASLSRGITAEEYTAQTTIDLFPRLHVGGKISFADYSDDNDMSGYSFWGTFILKTQPDYVYFRAGYEFIDYQDSAGGTGGYLDDGFQEDDHPYWSPVNYWRNQYTLGYKHTYSDSIVGHEIPGFFSALYSVEYDSEGELFHRAETGLHLEMTESWLFSFNGSVDVSEEYDAFNLDTTIEYRW